MRDKSAGTKRLEQKFMATKCPAIISIYIFVALPARIIGYYNYKKTFLSLPQTYLFFNILVFFGKF